MRRSWARRTASCTSCSGAWLRFEVQVQGFMRGVWAQGSGMGIWWRGTAERHLMSRCEFMGGHLIFPLPNILSNPGGWGCGWGSGAVWQHLPLLTHMLTPTRPSTAATLHRLGDRLCGNVLDVDVRAYVYRWTPVVTLEGEMLPYTVQELELTPGHPQLRCVAERFYCVAEVVAEWKRQEGRRWCTRCRSWS